MPAATDDDGDNTTVEFAKDAPKFLQYDDTTHSIFIEQGASNHTEIGSQQVKMYLTDDFRNNP